MARISLVEQYDNRSVIEQIRGLTDRVEGAEGGISGAVNTANEALGKVNVLSPKVADNTASIADLDTRVGTNTDGIDSLETRVGTPDDRPDPVGTLFARVKDNTADIATNTADIDQAEGRIESLETITAGAITSAEFTATASTVTSVHKHIDQAVDSDPLPVASSSQAGVINASDYRSIVQMRQDINELRGTVITYQVNLPSDEPTQAQITNVFTTSYPLVTLVAGIKIADYNRNLAYQYDGATWVSQPFASSISIATDETIGGVLSSDTDGEIAVNVEGTMSLNGYDSIVSRLDDIDGEDGRLDSLESADVSMMFEISGIQSDIDSIEGDIGDIQTDIGEIQTDITAIETSVAGKQDSLSTASASLAVADWANNEQTVSVTGVLVSSIVWVSPAPTSTEAYVNGGITCVSQSNGSLTFACAKVPTVAVSVNVVIA